MKTTNITHLNAKVSYCGVVPGKLLWCCTG